MQRGLARNIRVIEDSIFGVEHDITLILGQWKLRTEVTCPSMLWVCLCFASLLVWGGETDVQDRITGVGCVFSPLYLAEGIGNVGWSTKGAEWVGKMAKTEKNLRSDICKVLQGKQFLHLVNQGNDACEFRMDELKNTSYFVWPSKQLIKSGEILFVVVNFAFTEREINSRTAFGANWTSHVVVPGCKNCHQSCEFWTPISYVTSLNSCSSCCNQIICFQRIISYIWSDVLFGRCGGAKADISSFWRELRLLTLKIFNTISFGV